MEQHSQLETPQPTDTVKLDGTTNAEVQQTAPAPEITAIRQGVQRPALPWKRASMINGHTPRPV